MPETLQLNGVDAVTGDYLVPQVDVREISLAAQGLRVDPGHLRELRAKDRTREANYGLVYGVDPDELGEAGWGVIFPSSGDGGVREALGPLLSRRREEARGRYREFSCVDGYRNSETCLEFLARHGMGPGPAEPRKVPYYLLLVGGPEEIPFRFQFELDVNYAVGRLHLDSVEDYARYARSVVAAETAPRPARRAVFFGTSNPGDPATARSCRNLVPPLANALPGAAPGGWSFETILGADATKSRLKQALIGSPAPPALLFTASHGIGFPKDHPMLSAHQGALLCQDWPGPLRHRGEIPPDWYFSAADLDDSANLSGLIAFHFACFGAGTPRWESFARRGSPPREIAPRDLISGLPRRLLSLPGGGALAVVGHVERAWTYSFDWPGAGVQVGTFESALTALVKGARIGFAMEAFAMKYASIAIELQGWTEDITTGRRPDDLELARLWTANADARNYVVLGDPAVRLK